MRNPSTRTWLAIVLGLVIVAALVQGPAQYLPTAAVLVYGALRLRGELGRLWSTTTLSRKWTGILAATFALSIIAGGHGVVPVGLILLRGWSVFPVGVGIGWLALIALGLALPRASFAPVLALLGVVLALIAWVLFQTRSDEPLASVLLSSPFLACAGIYVVHLARIRNPVRTPESGSDEPDEARSPQP